MDSKLGTPDLGRWVELDTGIPDWGDQFDTGGLTVVASAEVLRAQGGRNRLPPESRGPDSHNSPERRSMCPGCQHCILRTQGLRDGAAVGLSSRSCAWQAFCHEFWLAPAWPVHSGHHYQPWASGISLLKKTFKMFYYSSFLKCSAR